jgi:hypothetical protein
MNTTRLPPSCSAYMSRPSGRCLAGNHMISACQNRQAHRRVLQRMSPPEGCPGGSVRQSFHSRTDILSFYRGHTSNYKDTCNPGFLLIRIVKLDFRVRVSTKLQGIIRCNAINN